MRRRTAHQYIKKEKRGKEPLKQKGYRVEGSVTHPGNTLNCFS